MYALKKNNLHFELNLNCDFDQAVADKLAIAGFDVRELKEYAEEAEFDFRKKIFDTLKERYERFYGFEFTWTLEDVNKYKKDS